MTDLIDFRDELQNLLKNAFGIAAHVIIEQFIYVKKPLNLKKSKNQAHLENGTLEQIIPHLEMGLEFSGLEAPDELETETVTHKTAKTNGH